MKLTKGELFNNENKTNLEQEQSSSETLLLEILPKVHSQIDSLYEKGLSTGEILVKMDLKDPKFNGLDDLLKNTRIPMYKGFSILYNYTRQDEGVISFTVLVFKLS